jgi:2-polyprenyl-3-methyl-5-hydroxy-6-metoxy-1,4-benzoquinol methylase
MASAAPVAEASIEFVSNVQSVAFPDEWYGLTSPDHFWFQWRLAAALAQVRDVGIPPDEPLRALEVGSGGGVLRDQLETSTRWTVDITDLNLPALQAAHKGRGRHLYYDILEERPQFVGAYDVVIAFDVIEHLDDPRPFTRSLLRHLRPRGHVLVNVPACPSLFSGYDVAVGHRRRYDRRSLAAEFAETDVEVRDIRYWGLTLVPLLLARKLVLAWRPPDAATIRTGFRPPGPLAHGVLRALMSVDIGLRLAHPPIGTSLLLAARKRA